MNPIKNTPLLCPWEARDSGIHGRGVFCLAPIARRTLIATYDGKLLSEDEAAELYGDGAGHTFLFGLSDGAVIDGGQGGNDSRFINHGCAPNVEADEVDGRIDIYALLDIKPGAELLLDYRLVADGDDAEAAHPCRCGAPTCRGTLVWRERRGLPVLEDA